MEFVVRDRGAGKTTRVVEWAAEDPDNVIVTAHQPRFVIDMLAAELQGRGVKNAHGRAQGQVVTMDQLRSQRLRGRECRYAVDDVDAILYNLLGFVPEVVTATGTVDRPETEEERRVRAEELRALVERGLLDILRG